MVTRIGSSRAKRHYLKAWREDRDLTQEQLAERIGTTKENISRWENYRRQMNEGIIASLADALSIDVTDMWRDPQQPSADRLLIGVSDAERAHAIDILRTVLRREAS